MFRSLLSRILFPAALVLVTPHASFAQYLYLDANGDGIWTSADRMNPNGTPTVVDAWINTSHNRDGSLASCDTGDGDMGFWNSYAVNLGTSSGTVAFSNFINQQAGFDLTCVGVGVDFLSNSTEMTVCRATAISEAGGLKKMFTVTVTGLSGNPSLQFKVLGELSPNFTSFGTPCSGNDFDNTYKLGSDFFDHDGVANTDGVSSWPPLINCPAAVGGGANSSMTLSASALDPDGSAVVLTQTNNTPFLSGPSSVGPAPIPTLTLTGTPHIGNDGSYAVHWTATDNSSSSTATTRIVVGGIADQAPSVTAPGIVAIYAGSPIMFSVSATDPDGDAITSLVATGTAIAAGASFTAGAGNLSGTLTWTPTTSQTGTFVATFTASNALSAHATTSIQVAPREINIVSNSSFETSTVGWKGHDGGTIERVAGGFDGNYALEIRGPAVGTGKFSVNDSPNWVVRAPAAGTVYRFSAWVRATGPAGKAQLRVRQYLGQIHEASQWSTLTKLGPEWQKLTMDVTAVVAGVTLDWQIMDAPIAPGEVFQTDDVSIVLLGTGASIASESSDMEVMMAPNPLNPEAVLSFTTREPGPVRVQVYSANGRHVRTLSVPESSPGRQAVRFDGMDASGRRLASGVYFYRIEAGHSRATGRFAVVK